MWHCLHYYAAIGGNCQLERFREVLVLREFFFSFFSFNRSENTFCQSRQAFLQQAEKMKINN